MPRYYFHFDDCGSRRTDPEGINLPDAEAAWYQGIRSACDIVRDHMAKGALRPGQRFEVEDDQGEFIWALPLEEVVELVA